LVPRLPIDTLSGDVIVEPLGHDDVDAAYRLSASVGWNQTRADWRRLLDLNPTGCFTIRAEGRLVATATLAAYAEQVGWVGMVIVDEAFRGLGLGTTMLRRVIDHGHETGTTRLGLDATPFGRSLYEKHGFETVGGIDRWGGALGAPVEASGARALRDEDLPDLLALDRRACGVDRGPLLRYLLQEEANRAWVVRGADGLQAFAVLRPGRQHAQLGPLVATSHAGIQELFDIVAQELAGGTVLMDALRRESTAQALSARGLHRQRELTRMHLRSLPVGALHGEAVILASGLEWG
jgi:GNAT superfamily N-acetyltransferase